MNARKGVIYLLLATPLLTAVVMAADAPKLTFKFTTIQIKKLSSYGGAKSEGTILKISKAGEESVLHSFSYREDGAYLTAGLFRDAKGTFYGAAPYGRSGNGTVFKMSQTGKVTVLYRFHANWSNGTGPSGVIRDAKGNLYGTAGGGDLNCNGGIGCGLVFKLTPAGKEIVLYRFMGGSDGWGPAGAPIQDGHGTLYGTTFLGGESGCGWLGVGCGVVFKLTP